MKYLYLITLFTVGEVANTRAQDKVFMDSMRMMDRATPTMKSGRER